MSLRGPQTNRADIRFLVLRMLAERPRHGYELARDLRAKGFRTERNYLHKMLKALYTQGLLRKSWQEGPHGPRRLVYSLAEPGRTALRMEAAKAFEFLRSMYDIQAAVSGLAVSIPEMFLHFADVTGPHLNKKRVVQYASYVDPTVCNTAQTIGITRAFPDKEHYIVKPPYVDAPANLEGATVLNGLPHDIPLRDGFAEVLGVDGLIGCRTVEEAMREWHRILAPGGLLYLMIPKSIVSGEDGPIGFADYIERTYYETKGGLVASATELTECASEYFDKVASSDYLGYIHIFAEGKKERVRREAPKGIEIKR